MTFLVIYFGKINFIGQLISQNTLIETEKIYVFCILSIKKYFIMEQTLQGLSPKAETLIEKKINMEPIIINYRSF
jgi:hypothetical protein